LVYDTRSLWNSVGRVVAVNTGTVKATRSLQQQKCETLRKQKIKKGLRGATSGAPRTALRTIKHIVIAVGVLHLSHRRSAGAGSCTNLCILSCPARRQCGPVRREGGDVDVLWMGRCSRVKGQGRFQILMTNGRKRTLRGRKKAKQFGRCVIRTVSTRFEVAPLPTTEEEANRPPPFIVFVRNAQTRTTHNRNNAQQPPPQQATMVKQQDGKKVVKSEKMTQGEKKKLKNDNKAKANPGKAAAKKEKNDSKRERRYVYPDGRRNVCSTAAQFECCFSFVPSLPITTTQPHLLSHCHIPLSLFMIPWITGPNLDPSRSSDKQAPSVWLRSKLFSRLGERHELYILLVVARAAGGRMYV
jgi:hypothetical protein